MFHEVKIYDKTGKVKKVLSSNKLSKQYWGSFFNNSLNDVMQKGKGHKKQTQKKRAHKLKLHMTTTFPYFAQLLPTQALDLD